MNEDRVIERTIDFVKKYFEKDATGHDFWHTFRVYENAIKIAKHENCDLFVVQLASLLHDVDDEKINKTNTCFSMDFMQKQKLPQEVIDQVMYIIKNQSYRNSIGNGPLNTIEAKIVQDADRLDAIGAIALARTFTYGGKYDRIIYDPDEEIRDYKNIEEYRKSNSSTINHIYEKLIKLKNLLNTKTAKKIAKSRHAFMLDFLDQFKGEWESKR